MRVQPVPVLLAIALSLTGAGAFATDYSMLYKPSFARLSLLSSQRVFQSECAGLAIHLAQTRPASYKSAASRLGEAVSRRIGADLGDLEDGRLYVDGKARNYISAAYDPETIKGLVNTMEPKCRSLIGKANEGDSVLAEALGPVPSSPLQLPGPEKCVAVLSYGMERKAEILTDAGDFVALLRKDRLENVGSDEAARRELVIKSEADALRAQAPDDGQVFGMILTCFPLVHETAMRWRESGESR